ncbi:MAG: hypothetical protein KAS57_00580 [Gammaproteobacteria bacterium]|nr:hypothetical protein [Gammaproteobacteria bacterium]
MKKKVIIGIAALAVTTFAFLTWYKFHYSMDIAESFEVNTPELKHKVLIATQGSKYKDALVAEIVDHLRQRQTYIKVIDVTALPQVNEDKWNAIVVIHTWENLKPQIDAKVYLERVKDLKKFIVLSTSGNGDHKIEGINAITSASVMSDLPSHTIDIKNRLDSILGRDVQK